MEWGDNRLLGVHARVRLGTLGGAHNLPTLYYGERQARGSAWGRLSPIAAPKAPTWTHSKNPSKIGLENPQNSAISYLLVVYSINSCLSNGPMV
jgi:hypothetical protein